MGSRMAVEEHSTAHFTAPSNARRMAVEGALPAETGSVLILKICLAQSTAHSTGILLLILLLLLLPFYC